MKILANLGIAIERYGASHYNEKAIILGKLIISIAYPKGFDKGAQLRFIKQLFIVPWYYPEYKDKFKLF